MYAKEPDKYTLDELLLMVGEAVSHKCSCVIRSAMPMFTDSEEWEYNTKSYRKVK